MQKPPSDDFVEARKDSQSYARSQALGAALRTHNMQGFEFFQRDALVKFNAQLFLRKGVLPVVR